MKNANLGWLFYREYFRGFTYPELPTDSQEKKRVNERTEKFFARKDRLLYDFMLQNYKNKTSYASLPVGRFSGFELVTDYPGMLIGSGYTHDISAVGATKMGFYFDHTTGLPTVPGSSIKGILRSAFPIRDRDAKKEESQELAKGKMAYLKTRLVEAGVDKRSVNDDFVLALESQLFEGTLANGKQIPMPDRFVCHDAVVIDAASELMGPDFITPHKKPATGEPNPIQLIKVMPGVTFRFTFQISELVIGTTTLPATVLLQLVKWLLFDLGIGAKTNVGYGQLADPKAAPSQMPSTVSRSSGSSSSNASSNMSSPNKVTELPEFKPTADKWYPAARLNPKRPPKVNAKVLKVLGERSVEVQLLILGLTDKSPVKCELKIFVDDLPALGLWVKVAIKSFAGKKAAAKDFLLIDNNYELIGKSSTS